MSNVTTSLKYAGQELTQLVNTGASHDSVVVRRKVDRRPQRRVTKILIPGRNGAQYVDNDEFENVPVSYTMVFPSDYVNCAALVNFLMAQNGYNRLEDQYDPDTYRMARVSGFLDPVSPDDEKGYLVINFECQPERWLKTSTTITAPDNLDVSVTNDRTLCYKLATITGGDYSFISDGTNWFLMDSPPFPNDGFINIPNGNYVAYEYYKTTDYIAVTNGQKFLYKLSHGTGQQYPVISKYDSSQAFESDKCVTWNNVGYAQGVYTVSGSGYIRATYATARPDAYLYPHANLSDYGLSVTGTPVSGDTFTVHIENPSFITITDNTSHDIVNPTLFTAKPLIHIYGNGVVDFGATPFNKYSMTISDNGTNGLYVDSDKEDCYWTPTGGVSANDHVTFSGTSHLFPLLEKQKTTTVTLASGITKVYLEPRWWKL